MSDDVDRGEADLGSAPSSRINEGQSSYETSRFPKSENEQINNAFVVRSSRFIKREDRDPRLFLSPRYDDYLVLKSETDLIARLESEYVLSEVFDQLAEESPKIRELFTWKIWKEEALREITKTLLETSVSFGVSMEMLKISSDGETRNLYARSMELSEAIQAIDTQIQHIRNFSGDKEIWSDPVPFPEELLPVLPFDLSFLPEPLRRYAKDVSETIQCPIDYVAVGLVVSFSSIIGAGCAIRPLKEGDWTVVPNLWGAIIGPPSVKKTPALNAAMIPIASLEKRADEDFANEKLKAEVDKVEREARRKTIKARIEEAVKNENEQVIESNKTALLSLESEISPTRCKRFKTNDTTVAKLTELLAENPRGLLVFRDELIGFLMTLEQEGREDSRAFYIEAWTGWSSSGVKTDRIMRGTTSCNPCISILGGIQPSKLRLYLQQTLSNIGNDGFIQRFQLLVFPDRLKEWKLVDRRPDSKARAQVKDIGAFLADTDFISIGGRIEEDFPLPIFRFDIEAQEFFFSWYRGLEERLIKESDDGMIIEHLAKYRSLMPSIALESYLARIASGASPGTGVALEDAKSAADLCGYLETHARRVYSMIEHRGIYAAKALLKKIREGEIGDGFTQREVYRKGWSGLDSKGTEDACAEMIAKGWIKEEITPTTPRGGASGTKYRLHPILRKSSEAGADKTDE